MKTMSIIGIVWFSISLLCILAFYETDLDAAIGWGMLGMLYAIPYSIVGLINSNKIRENSSYNELIKLNDLKEKGILSEDEFNSKKMELLRK